MDQKDKELKQRSEALRKKMGLTEEQWQEQHELFKKALDEPTMARKILPIHEVNADQSELNRLREEVRKPIKIRCGCGGKFIKGEEDCMGRLKPYSEAAVNCRWACQQCGHEVLTGPCWGG